MVSTRCIYGFMPNSHKKSWMVSTLKVLNDNRLILNIQGDQFKIIQNLQRSTILQTNNWSGTFLDPHYIKIALEWMLFNLELMYWYNMLCLLLKDSQRILICYTFCLCLFGSRCWNVASSVASAKNETLIEATIKDT